MANHGCFLNIIRTDRNPYTKPDGCKDCGNLNGNSVCRRMNRYIASFTRLGIKGFDGNSGIGDGGGVMTNEKCKKKSVCWLNAISSTRGVSGTDCGCCDRQLVGRENAAANSLTSSCLTPSPSLFMLHSAFSLFIFRSFRPSSYFIFPASPNPFAIR